MYEVRFNDGERVFSTPYLQKAIEYRNNNNFHYISRSLHIWEITTHGGWNETKLV